jgi:hypothetical protein
MANIAEAFSASYEDIASSRKEKTAMNVLAKAQAENWNGDKILQAAALSGVSDNKDVINYIMSKKKEEADKAAADQETQFNVQMGPVLNQEIGGYLKANPEAMPMQQPQSGAIKNDTIPQPAAPQQQSGANQFALGSDSFNQNLSNFAKTLQGESSLSGIPSTDLGSVQQGQENIDTSTVYNGILKDIPVKTAKDLIFDFHNKLISPKEFFKTVADIKKGLNAIADEDEKANRASMRKIREQGMQSQGEVDKQYVVNEGGLEQQNAQDAAALQRIREENASKERIAAMNVAGEKDKNADKYSERTFSLKPGQVENLINYDDAQAQIQTIKNLYDEAYTGFLKGRVGSIKDFFGALPEKEAAFRSAKQKFDNAMIKLQAGSAVSKAEAERMVKELGDFTKGREQFNAIIDRTLSTINNGKTIYINGLKKSKYDVGEWGNEVKPIDISGGINKTPAANIIKSKSGNVYNLD